MGGFEVARWREKICCVLPKRVAGVGFATFMEYTSLLRFFENHWFLLVSPSCSRIPRKMMRFWFSCDWLCRCAFCAAAHIADAHATHLHPLRSTAHAHHARHAHLRIVCAEYVSVHNTRRRRIIRAHAHYLRICGAAHHLRSCTCAHTLRAHLLRPCAAPFVYAALGHAAFAHARIVIQGAAEAAAGSGSPPPPSVGARRGLLVGSGWRGEC